MDHSPTHHTCHSPPVRVGLMLALDGAAGLWAPSAIASAQLATEELNTAGGILGRPVEFVTIDCGPDGETAALNVRGCMRDERISALVGMFPSYARADVAATVGDRIPFLYTPQFEGGERARSIITTGETTAELLGAAVEWVTEHRGARRYFLCGSDYRWPRESFAVARRLIAGFGGEVVGEAFQCIGDHDYDMILEAVEDSRADAVVPMFLGLDAVAFNRAFAAAGLSRRMLRCVPGIDETIVFSLAADETENLYAASGYFASQQSARNGAFLERYHARFGDSPPPANAYGTSVYEGFHALGALAQASASLDSVAVRRAVGRAAPRRSARGAGHPVGARPTVLVGEVDGYDIRIVREQPSAAP